MAIKRKAPHPPRKKGAPSRRSLFAAREVPLSLIVFVLLALTLLARLAFAEGLLFDESLTIGGNARSLVSFDSTGPDQGILAQGKEFLRELRVMPADSWPVTVALGLSYALFGISDLTSLLPALLASLLAGYLIYFLGSQMFAQATGLLAAFLWAILPLSVFLSINLLPILPLVAINLLAVTLFFWATRSPARWGYPTAVFVAAVGLVLEWTFFLPTLVFILVYSFRDKQIPQLKPIGIALGLLILAALLLPGTGQAMIELYGLNLLLFDNFLLLPLLLISLVFVASLKRDGPLQFLLLWLGVKAAFIFLVAPLILEKPLLQTIGFSGYWLDLIPPALLLISYQFARRYTSLQITWTLIGISVIAAAGLIFLIPVSTMPPWLATILRISVGLAFLCIFLYLAFWKENRRLGNGVLLAALLSFLTLASLSIVNNYVASYMYPVEDASEVMAYLASKDGDATVFVGDDFVYERLLYLGGFQNPQPLDGDDYATVYLLNANRPNEVPQGVYVLVSSEFLNFVLGITPSHWDVVKEFSHSGQQKLILYHVLP